MPVQSKQEKVETARNVVEGVKKCFAPTDVVPIDGEPVTCAAIGELFQSQLDAIAAVAAAYAAWQEALAAERRLRVRARTVSVDLRSHVWRSRGAAGLALFQWRPPKKTGPKTLAGKLAAVQKRAKKKASK
jgi:hypothetical protein